MPLNLKNLPHDGYSDRENSDAVNQIIRFAPTVFGGNSSVRQFTIPPNGLASGPFQIIDPGVRVNSFIALAPANIAARIASIDITLVSDGLFEVNDPPDELQFAAAQVVQSNGIVAGGLASPGAILPFDTVLLDENWNIDLGLNRITSLIFANIQMSITVSGLYATGRDYEFGVQAFNSSDVLLNTFTLKTSTGNQNDVVSVGGSLLTQPIVVGDYLVPFGLASGTAVQFEYDMSLGVTTIAPDRGRIVTEELIYNYVVVQ